MRISTARIFDNALRALQTQQAGIARTQSELARGTTLLSPADDPAGAKRVLDLRDTLALNERYLANADAATTRLTLEESTLDAVTNVLQRVRELTVQANNAPLTDTDRRALAEEVGQRLEELLGLANTTDGNNEYLFAGFSSGVRPFASTASGIVYNGDEGQRFLSLGPGFDVAVGDSGTRVFRDIGSGNGTFRTGADAANGGEAVIDAGRVVDPSSYVSDTYTITFTDPATFEVRDSGGGLVASGAYQSPQAIVFNGHEVGLSGNPAAGDRFEIAPASPQDVFTTVAALAETLRGGAADGPERARMHTALGRSLSELDGALENILTVRAAVGARLNAAQNERFVAEDFGIQIEASISAIEDVDLAEAVTRLSQQSATLEAAQRSFALVQNLSLFNFI